MGHLVGLYSLFNEYASVSPLIHVFNQYLGYLESHNTIRDQKQSIMMHLEGFVSCYQNWVHLVGPMVHLVGLLNILTCGSYYLTLYAKYHAYICTFVQDS